MSPAEIRAHCLSLPHVTEHVQWGDNLVFKIGREALGGGAKIFAITSLDPGGWHTSFKSTPEEFAELVERPGIIPAPYLARAHWVSIENPGALSRTEFIALLTRAHELIFSAMPKTKRALVRGEAPVGKRSAGKRSVNKRVPGKRPVAKNKK